MKVLLVGNYLADDQESMQRFAVMLESALIARDVKVRLLRPKPWLIRLVGAAANPYEGLAKWLGYLDKFVLFPLFLRGVARGYDLVHICDHSNAMYGRWTAGKPWMITCNDLLAVRSALGEFPQNPTGRLGRLLQKWILHWLNRAPTIACISEATRQDVLRLTAQPEDRAIVIHMGLNHPYRRRSPKEWKPILSTILDSLSLKETVRFVFHVGGNHWYKNREGVIRLFAGLRSRGLDLHLFIAGKSATHDQIQLIHDLGLTERVFFLGAVSNGELEALYHGAEFLLFPSLAEGFGWPVIEAQACGCPVVTSNIVPLPEVGGSSAVYLNLENESECMSQMEELLKAPEVLRAELVHQGLANLQRFDPQIMVDHYLAVYGKILAKASEL